MSSFDQFLQIPSRSTLFVGDLSYFCTEEHLKRLFAPYGASVNGMPTVSAEIKRGKYGDSLMHGFVYLSSVEAADLAIQDLNNKKFMGRYMR
jgi:RNA recognition motif-containing protein